MLSCGLPACVPPGAAGLAAEFAAQQGGVVEVQRDFATALRLTGKQWRALRDGLSFDRQRRPVDIAAWLEPFDPIKWGDPYVEGSAWQHRWDVPHNFAAVMESLGGEKKTVAVLEQMLTMPADFNVGRNAASTVNNARAIG